jgi:hypothetical protein
MSNRTEAAQRKLRQLPPGDYRHCACSRLYTSTLSLCSRGEKHKVGLNAFSECSGDAAVTLHVSPLAAVTHPFHSSDFLLEFITRRPSVGSIPAESLCALPFARVRAAIYVQYFTGGERGVR